ncbi:MAG: T9SS type A sorting domain-containing protein, partial [Bacteroidales bacterium]|nr:T9SS type A sorting domain-containing protein [Bacteroidales bacterium]
HKKIQVSDYSKGVYFLNILTDKGSVNEKVIIR